MQKHTGYLLALLILCAHNESKTIEPISMLIVAGIGWFAGTHYWNVASKREFKIIREDIQNMKQELKTDISDLKGDIEKHAEDIVSRLDEKLNEYALKASNLRREDLEQINKEIAEARAEIKKYQETILADLAKFREEQKRHAEATEALRQDVQNVDKGIGVVRGEVQHLRRDMQTGFTQHEERQQQQFDNHTRRMTEIAVQQAQQQKQENERNQNALKVSLNQKIDQRTQTILDRLEREKQDRAKELKDLNELYTKNQNASEEKMQELVEKSEEIISRQVQSLGAIVAQYNSTSEQNNVLVLSKITEISEEYARNLDLHYNDFGTWKSQCNERLTALEVGQQQTMQTLELHGSLILKLQEENKELKKLLILQSEKQEEQSQTLAEIVVLMKENNKLAKETRDGQKEAQGSLYTIEYNQNDFRRQAEQLVGGFRKRKPLLGSEQVTDMDEEQDPQNIAKRIAYESLRGTFSPFDDEGGHFDVSNSLMNLGMSGRDNLALKFDQHS